MESYPTDCYKGHSVFRNQPSYKFFNKTFEDPTDALYLCLNDIHPFFLQKDQLKNNLGFEHQVVIDPRTKEKLQDTIIDHTNEYRSKPKIFYSRQKSTLTKKQHEVCISVLLANQQNRSLPQNFYDRWHAWQKLREDEKSEVDKVILEYAKVHRNEMYLPVQKLVELYKEWYQRRVEYLLAHEEKDVFYNTQSGLPLVRICGGLSTESTADLINIKIVAFKGWVPLWKDVQQVDYQSIFPKLSNLMDSYNAAESMKEKFCEEEINAQLQTVIDETVIDAHSCLLPLDTLLFLLNAGDYVDLPSEAVLEISEGVGESKLLKFSEMLPSRNCGWHTHAHVVEKACWAFISMNENIQWAKHTSNGLTIEKNQSDIEINATLGNRDIEFRPKKIEEFLLNNKLKSSEQPQLKTCVALVKWDLKESETNEVIKIMTSAELPTVMISEKDLNSLSSWNVKLEYKPQFGCEVMTKYELLRIWFHQRFLKKEPTAKCLRISTADFSPQLEENLTLESIEQELTALYHVRMPIVMANLHRFLKLLLNFPPNRYILRYSPKYADKFLLCAPSTERTQNTLNFQMLVESSPSDLQFLSQQPFLPISDHLCSKVHLYHMTMPCAFPHFIRRTQGIESNLRSSMPAFLNDRSLLLKIRMDKRNKKRLQVKKQQNARRRKRQKAEQHDKDKRDSDHSICRH